MSEIVVRRIWGTVDTILLIFAGSAAEFALNKAVDWLFETNALPNAPIDRFFETVRFAQAIVYGNEQTAANAINLVNRAHQGVEHLRGDKIPQWSYRDTLFMLIDYGERAYNIVFDQMTPKQRQFHFESSLEIGRYLHIQDLPTTYDEYRLMRQSHLENNTARTPFTDALYQSYREHLGWVRTKALLDLQASIVPARVAHLLNLKRKPHVDLMLSAYRHLRSERGLRLLYPIMLPPRYAKQLAALDRSGRFALSKEAGHV